MANKLNKLIQGYELLSQQSGPVVLATIIETLGSTYQKAGARMLIAEDGEFTGLLGGGCFESDLREQADSVFADGQAKVVFYDMRSPDDAVWGLGLGCNGAVRVLLQLLTADNDFYPLDRIAQAYRQNETAVLATVCDTSDPEAVIGNTTYLPAIKQDQQFTLLEDHPLYANGAKQALLQDKPAYIEHDIDDRKLTVFYDVIKPASRLLILGAGPDAVPVTEFAAKLGWHITLLDHRPAYIRPERFPAADQLLNITPGELNEKLDLDQFDALVLMTHSIDYDERYRKVIADSRIPYLGLLGPAKRRDRLLDSLGEKAEGIKARVYGPIGLDIGAESPEEIALSIMAEIQAVINQRDGGQLFQKDLPLHERVTPN